MHPLWKENVKMFSFFGTTGMLFREEETCYALIYKVHVELWGRLYFDEFEIDFFLAKI